MLFVQGCSTSRIPLKAEDNTKQLLSHPEFRAAAIAAPNFTKEALLIIVRLETEKANAGR
jgi:hypothetical protein